MKRVLIIAGSYLAFSVVAAICLLIMAFPDHPTTPTGWTLLLLLSIPILIVGELFGKVIWRNRVARYIDEKTAGTALSGARMMYGVVALLMAYLRLFIS
jgi:hypothetical protein